MANHYTPLKYEQLTAEQKQLRDQIATSRKLDSTQSLGGPFDPFLESPVLGGILSNLGYFHRFQSSPQSTSNRTGHFNHGGALPGPA